MHDIAAAAGVTQSLIHHHFGAKDALWRDVRRDAVLAYHERIEAAFAASDGPSRAVMADLFAHLAEEPHLMRLVAWVELEGEAVSLGCPTALACIAEAQARGRVRADVSAAHLLTAFLGVVRTWFADRNLVADESDAEGLRKTDAAYLDAAWSVFSRGAVDQGPV